MNGHPDSPWVVLALGLGCAAISYGCHKLLRAVEANKILPLNSKLKGDQGIGLFRGTWPFKDKYQAQFAQRSMLHLNLLMWKWVMAFVAVLMALSPIIDLIKFAG